MKKPKILLYDLETFPNKGLFWAGKMYETNIIKVVEYGGLASVAWKWLGQERIACLTREGKKNDKSIVDHLWNLFDEADIVIAHNGVEFDQKVTNTNLIKYPEYGTKPPSPYQVVDTRKEAGKHFRFDSNSLDSLARFLGVGRKLPHKGFDMWEECMNDEKPAWQEMTKYNKHDVFLLEGCYLKLRPWMKTHPNLSLITDRPLACPRCSTENTLEARGFVYTVARKYRQFRCKECGQWSRGKPVKAEKSL
jgi:hypothetical protein